MAKIRKFTEEDTSQLLNQEINAKWFYISKTWDYESSDDNILDELSQILESKDKRKCDILNELLAQ